MRCIPRSFHTTVRRSSLAGAMIVLAATLVAPASAAPFAWSDLSATDGIQINLYSITPSNPLRAASLPIRWDSYYDPATDLVVETFLTFGLPTGYSDPNGLYVSMPVAGNNIGSATYNFAPIPVAPQNYTWTNVGPANGLTSASITVLGGVEIASVDIMVETKVLGIWIEIPAISSDARNAVTWDDAGDYYLKATFYDAAHVQQGAFETYFTTDSATFPAESDSLVAYHPIPEPMSVGSLLILSTVLISRRTRSRDGL